MDTNNCGQCGLVCSGGPNPACNGGLCGYVVASGQGQVFGIAADAKSIYWTSRDQGTVMSAAIDGTVLAALASSQSAPTGIATDSANVYWMNGDGSVMMVPVVGGTPTTVSAGSGGAKDGPSTNIGTDGVSVYWADSPGGRVMSAPVGGTGSPVVLASGQNQPQGLAIDASNVYWVTADDSIWSVLKTGNGLARLSTGAGANPQGSVGIGVTGVYWTNPSDQTVKRVPVGGGVTGTLANSQSSVKGIASDGTQVVWTAQDDGTVMLAPPKGGPAIAIAREQQSPTSITLNALNIYWTNQGDGTVRFSPRPVTPRSDQSVDVRAFGAVGDGVTDDSAAFQRAVNAIAGSGTALLIPPSTFHVSNYTVLPSDITIVGSPGAVIDCDIGRSVGSVDAAFVSYVIDDESFASTTLAAPAVVGNNTVSVVTSMSTGTWVAIGNHLPADHPLFRQGVYRIESVSGTGPYTLTLDRAVVWDFVSGDIVDPVNSAWNVIFDPTRHTVPHNIQILGRGLKITGTAQRFIEVESSRDVLVDDVTFDASHGTGARAMWMSFDVGSYNCEGRRIRANVPFGLGLSGTLSMESSEDVRYVDCSISGASDSVGFLGFDAQHSEWRNDTASGCSDGMRLTSGIPGNLAGCRNDLVSGGAYSANFANGIHVGNGPTLGSQDVQIGGVVADSNGTAGVFIDTYGLRVSLSNSLITNNGTYGVVLNSSAPGVGPVGCGAYDVDLSGDPIGIAGGDVDFVAKAISSTGNADFLVYWVGSNASSGALTLDGFATINGLASSLAGFLRADGGSIILANGSADGSSGQTMITVNNGAALQATNVKLSAPGASICVDVGPACIANLGSGVDLTGCATPIVADPLAVVSSP
jgi:hypothetical protein